MTEQNRNYIRKEIGKLLSEIWRIKGLSEQEYGSDHHITKEANQQGTVTLRHYYRKNRNKKEAASIPARTLGAIARFPQ